MKRTPDFHDVQPHKLNPYFRAAQVLADWIEPENRLTPTEIGAERAHHRLLVEFTRPTPGYWMRALAHAIATGERGAP